MSKQTVGAGVISNKIPEYAREYKKEYLYLKGIQKELKDLGEITLNYIDSFVTKYLKRRIKIINRFMFEQERGRLKNISSFKLKKCDFREFYLLDKRELFEVFSIQYKENLNIIYIEFLYTFYKFYDKLNFDNDTDSI